MILKHTIEINTSAEKVYLWLTNHMKDKESYMQWHPEHLEIKWLKGNACEEGSIVYIEESLQGMMQKLKFKFIEVIPNKLIRYRVLFPLSIIAPENKFTIESTGENSCTFTAMGKINMSEKFFLSVHKNHQHKLEATMKHMKEEGENLKKGVENHSI